ncbi:unnamed protein product [Ranitomeya imitator]|uniref:Uncharacterized protein n=1 Tax=Ranitomeya imitator TaxID=111125 RepID=A0ABN9L3N9_9NEOB|nr:unnamed protein product [Ranitomeya imitator]
MDRSLYAAYAAWGWASTGMGDWPGIGGLEESSMSCSKSALAPAFLRVYDVDQRSDFPIAAQPINSTPRRAHGINTTHCPYESLPSSCTSLVSSFSRQSKSWNLRVKSIWGKWLCGASYGAITLVQHYKGQVAVGASYGAITLVQHYKGQVRLFLKVLKTHYTEAMAASWAEKADDSINHIYKMAMWSPPSTLYKLYRLAAAVLEAVENNTLSIEPAGLQPVRFVKASAVECGGPKKCALSGQTKSCKHRIKLGDSSNYYYISPCCRYRITSVCNFFTYIRYIHQGLVKQQDGDSERGDTKYVYI